MRAARIVSTRRGAGAGQVPGTPTEPDAASPAWRLRAALVWGGAGFVAGAVFWHLVGFWSFVSEAVLHRTPTPHATVAAAARPNAVPATVVLVDADRCTALALDRRSNFTVAVACPRFGLALQVEPEDGTREDLAILAEPRVQPAGYRAD